ncbi:MAG TPA: ATP-binding protein [Holophagaceae bacterium]|nr:ATP-binding protein [Holophagaceae bacterium]
MQRSDSRQMQAEANPGLSPERMQALLESSWDILSLLDDQGNLLYNSPAAQRLHGLEAGEMAGRSTFEFIHPEDRDRVSGAMGACLAQPGTPVSVQYRYASKQHGWMWMEAVAVNRLEDPSIRAIVVNSRDISARVAAQEAERSRWESEQRYASLFMNMSQGFALCRMAFKEGRPDDFMYLEVNPAFVAHTGLAHLEGRWVTEVIPGIREADPEIFERYGRVVRTGEPARFESFVSSLGKWYSVSVYRPMEEHFVAVFEDVTERKRTEEERLNLEIQLVRSQKMESLGSLAGGVAHDMNNVLGSILGLASLHQELQPPGSPAQEAFATIAKACDRGGRLVRRLLDFARHDLSEVKELDLNALLKEEVQLLERTTLAKVRLDLDLAEGLRPIRGDASALTHALMNLCVNAVDAMPTGGTLSLRTRNGEPGWVEVEIADTGTGMPKDVLDKALDPFFTTKPQGKGTGLGLSIVYGTVKAHHGVLTITSEPGRGTRVLLRFPACEAPPAGSAEADPVGLQTPPRSLDILLVDDDELIRASMEAMIQALGHRVATVESGEAALEWLGSGRRPQLIILDMNMPGLGGAGTLPRLRALHPDLPVLLATGRADQAALDLTQAFPAVTLLPKPFTLGELRGRLEAFAPGPSGS